MKPFASIQGVAQRLLLLGAAATVLTMLYALGNRWGSLQDAAAWTEAALYYLLPLLAIAVILALCALHPRIDQLFCLLMLVAGYIGLLASEIYLQNFEFDRNAKIVDAARNLGYPLDTRSKAEVVADLRREGKDAVPFIRMISDARLLPIGTVPGATVVTCNEFGPWLVVQADRHGFNNPDAVWDETEPYDAVIVGDSYTFGECDAVTGGFAAILRQQGLRVLNIGIGGNEPLLNLASIVEYASNKRARYVFWMHFAGNDLSGLMQLKAMPLPIRYVEQPDYRQNLAGRSAEIGTALRKLEDESYPAAPATRNFSRYITQPKFLLRSLRLYALRSAFGLARNTVEDTDFPLFQRSLERARDTVRTMGAELVIVNIPAVQQIGKSGDDALERETRARVAAAGLRYLDLKPEFQKTPDYRALYAFGSGGGHFTPAGNRLTAEILSSVVQR